VTINEAAENVTEADGAPSSFLIRHHGILEPTCGFN
jgi:hypothetical protein